MSYPKKEYSSFLCRAGVGLMKINTGDMNAATIRIYDNSAIVNRRVPVQRKDATGKIEDETVQRIEVS